jgi:hypothetical protein
MLAYMEIIKCRIAKLKLTDTVCSRSGHCCRIRRDMLGDLELAVRHRAAQAEVRLEPALNSRYFSNDESTATITRKRHPKSV